MLQPIKIGTRASKLAVWQAKKVQQQLSQLNLKSELILIKSDGEKNLIQPLYELGITGIFTKELDIKLLENKIDIAVHSLKDVPTVLAKGLKLSAVLKRDSPSDVLIYKKDLPEKNKAYNVATGSLRRKCNWLHKYPNHNIFPLRGNINSRLEKLENNKNWDAIILAEAGIERLEMQKNYNIKRLDWMLPAPSQGALAVVAKAENEHLNEVLKKLEDNNTRLCVNAERQFLNQLQGGCTTPIGAFAFIENNAVNFTGNLFSKDATKVLTVSKLFEMSDEKIGEKSAQELIKNGAKEIIEAFKNDD